jgi:hypothetical protein
MEWWKSWRPWGALLGVILVIWGIGQLASASNQPDGREAVRGVEELVQTWERDRTLSPSEDNPTTRVRVVDPQVRSEGEFWRVDAGVVADLQSGAPLQGRGSWWFRAVDPHHYLFDHWEYNGVPHPGNRLIYPGAGV